MTEEIPPPSRCPVCGGDPQYLGIVCGDYQFRCQDCGMTYYEAEGVELEEEEADADPYRDFIDPREGY